MRKMIVGGNWKMNKNIQETQELLNELKAQAQTSDARVMIFPSFVSLTTAQAGLEGVNVEVGAQNMSAYDSGAKTGDVSADMIKSVGVGVVLLGHSERREFFGENEEIIAGKVVKAIENGLEVVYCCGEKLEEREADNHFAVIEEQVKTSLFGLSKEDLQKVVIAYEPVWAIGTGKTASAEQAQEVHAFIRGLIANAYDQATADSISIIYGGSVKPANANEIFSMADVDGGLIGGASLNAADFFSIVNAF